MIEILTSPLTFQSFCALLGFILLISKLFTILKTIFLADLRPEKDLLTRYGKGSYVLVTGASAGIGRTFCFSLARRGFNIVLISENLSQLQQAEKELKANYPSVQTKVILADFLDSHKEGFFKKIMDQLNGLDISMLINNVGIGTNDLLTNLSEEVLRATITINCVPMVIFSKLFIERFLTRQKRSCIINLSSLSAQGPLPIAQIYGATKTFMDYFSRALNLEYPQFDIMSLKPNFVYTNMTVNVADKMVTIYPEECVEAALRQVGYETETFGHWKHRIFATVIGEIPEWVRRRILKRVVAKRLLLKVNKKNV